MEETVEEEVGVEAVEEEEAVEEVVVEAAVEEEGAVEVRCQEAGAMVQEKRSRRMLRKATRQHLKNQAAALEKVSQRMLHQWSAHLHRKIASCACSLRSHKDN